MEDVPTFSLATRLAAFPRLLIIGMHLHRQLVAGEQELYQQRKAMFVGRSLTDNVTTKLLGQFS